MHRVTVEIEAADIPTMATMSITEYVNYLQTSLIFTDTHGNIRATQGEYPLACTKAQVEALIAYLQGKSSLLES